MRRSDFQYELPAELIAQQPLAERGAGRLLCLDVPSGALRDAQFTDLLDLLAPGDLLVLNDTRVIPARLWGRKASGGRVEVLLERVVDRVRALAHVRASKTPKTGSELHFDNALCARVVGREDDLFLLQFDLAAGPDKDLAQLLERIGHVPLPPYIRRADGEQDRTRYQTVYARRPGAVAAPTAGLHFDQAMLDRLANRGVELAWVTLHVGAGTFQPVRVDELTAHRMHLEYTEVPARTCEQVAACRARGGRVVAVGTTAVRSLESAARSGDLQPYAGETDLFIYPGYRFRCVDAMLTNFHLPESTLLMLVCAFGGYTKVLQAYQHAVAQRYRFFSYGDAMLLMGPPEAPA